jgi:endoglycosylceramidase
MNEPFTGSESITVLTKLLEAYGGIVAGATGETPSLEALTDMWGNEKMRIEALGTLDDKDNYSAIADNAYETVRTFEQGALSQFYQKVRDAVREVNKKHILFLEHSYFCNLGVKSSFLIPKDKDGVRDSLCVYAPHGYDLVTDTDAASTPSFNRTEVIFERIFEAGKEKGVPVVVGEWGAFYMGNEYRKPALHLIGLFEQAKVGQTYWAYWENIDKQDYFAEALSRCYPMLTNGILQAFGNDYKNNQFTAGWKETVEAPTRVYIPDLSRFKPENMELNPRSKTTIVPLDDNRSGYLEIAPAGGERRLTIRF